MSKIIALALAALALAGIITPSPATRHAPSVSHTPAKHDTYSPTATLDTTQVHAGAPLPVIEIEAARIPRMPAGASFVATYGPNGPRDICTVVNTTPADVLAQTLILWRGPIGGTGEITAFDGADVTDLLAAQSRGWQTYAACTPA